MTSIRTSVLGAALLAVACAYNPPPVPVEASPADLERLAGWWTGTYERENSGRRGSIEFNLVYGEDHAHGDVVMIPAGSHHSYQSWREDGVTADTGDSVEVLTIRFAAVEGGEVTGELDPYRDPDWTAARSRASRDACAETSSPVRSSRARRRRQGRCTAPGR